jgi:hypothetical protein
MASDSRITWGSEARRWDAGRKLFACKATADIFGYVGEVLFPSLVLGQISGAADNHLLFRAEDNLETRHSAVVSAIKISFGNRHNVDDHDFQILHGGRDGEGIKNATFRMWQLCYFKKTSKAAARWKDEELQIGCDHSALIVPLGSGGAVVEKYDEQLKRDPQGRTSRAAFWAFCDALKSKADPLSGGPPQLVGLYRTGAPRSFGVLYEGRRYFEGLPLPDDVSYNGVEWRDEYFQRSDPSTLQVLAGAKRHGRSRST